MHMAQKIVIRDAIQITGDREIWILYGCYGVLICVFGEFLVQLLSNVYFKGLLILSNIVGQSG